MKFNVRQVRFSGPTDAAGLNVASGCRSIDEHGRKTHWRMVLDTDTRLLRITYSTSNDSKPPLVEYVPLERCMSLRFEEDDAPKVVVPALQQPQQPSQKPPKGSAAS